MVSLPSGCLTQIPKTDQREWKSLHRTGIYEVCTNFVMKIMLHMDPKLAKVLLGKNSNLLDLVSPLKKALTYPSLTFCPSKDVLLSWHCAALDLFGECSLVVRLIVTQSRGPWLRWSTKTVLGQRQLVNTASLALAFAFPRHGLSAWRYWKVTSRGLAWPSDMPVQLKNCQTCPLPQESPVHMGPETGLKSRFRSNQQIHADLL